MDGLVTRDEQEGGLVACHSAVLYTELDDRTAADITEAVAAKLEAAQAAVRRAYALMDPNGEAARCPMEVEACLSTQQVHVNAFAPGVLDMVAADLPTAAHGSSAIRTRRQHEQLRRAICSIGEACKRAERLSNVLRSRIKILTAAVLAGGVNVATVAIKHCKKLVAAGDPEMHAVLEMLRDDWRLLHLQLCEVVPNATALLIQIEAIDQSHHNEAVARLLSAAKAALDGTDDGEHEAVGVWVEGCLELLQASAQHFEDAWTALREAEQRNLLHSPMGALVLKQVLLMAGAAVSVDQLCLNISNDKALLATMPRRYQACQDAAATVLRFAADTIPTELSVMCRDTNSPILRDLVAQSTESQQRQEA
ncbi:hypothetical protein COHA_001448 [Chlorella ohadii]|uniref:Uncharacterized protein n=1 Tax=Chlorella ohadii TaxID=2649997 RepID=A0AAD5DYZ4_9CHLO|nr:hypothetical protein COHA_001448 [Chlorella ohadii]